MILTLVQIFCWIIFIYLLISAFYLFLSAVLGRLVPPTRYSPIEEKKRIAVLIPTYKEDAIIINSAIKAKQHNYPKDKFEVFLVADSLQPETIRKLRDLPVNVLEVSFEKSSKARSLNKLLNYIPATEFEIALILDADNVMMDGCLEQINAAFHKGFKAVQIHRSAKNTNTSSALLDGISEEVNNHLFRRGMRAMGFSSITIGSGMAFEFWKLKEIYDKPGILGNPACDREVDFEVSKAGYVIEFIDDAVVLDEKVSSRAVFEKQRTRWLESQIIHLRLFFNESNWKDKNKHYWNKLFINLMLPRSYYIILFGLALIISCIDYLTPNSWIIPANPAWPIASGLFFSAFLLSIPSSYYNLRSLKAILQVPVLLFSIVRALFKMNVDREEFVHTPKTFSEDMETKKK